MSFYRRILLLSALLFANSCAQNLEQALILDAPLDYKEQIVMEGALIAGEPIRNIRLSRTVEPVQGTVSREAAALSTATVTLRTGGREYPMRLQAQRAFSSAGTLLWEDPRSYYAAEELIAEEGARYEITAQWNGKTASVATLVPRKPQILSAREIVSVGANPTGAPEKEFRYEAHFRTRVGEVYQVGVLTGSGADTLSATRNGIFGGVVQSANAADSAGTLRLQSQVVFQTRGQDGILQNPLNPHVVVYSFDEPFAAYYNSFQRGFAPTDPFTVGGVNVRWNVTGDGVGIVVGVASSRLRAR